MYIGKRLHKLRLLDTKIKILRKRIIMDETVTPRLEAPASPRTADDILFDLAALKDSDGSADVENDDLAALKDSDGSADVEKGIGLSDQLVSHQVDDIDDIDDNDLDVHVHFDSVDITTDNDPIEVEKVEFRDSGSDSNGDNAPGIKQFDADVVITDNSDSQSDKHVEDIEADVDMNSQTEKNESVSLNNTPLLNNILTTFTEGSGNEIVEIVQNHNLTNNDNGDGVNHSVNHSEEHSVGKKDMEDEDICIHSKEFSDVLTMAGNDLSNGDGFTPIVTTSVPDREDTGEDLEIEGEGDINLDNINIQEKQDESDSGSEFDFELPTTAVKQPDVSKDQTVKCTGDDSQTIKDQDEQKSAVTTTLQGESSNNDTQAKKSEIHSPAKSAIIKDIVTSAASGYPGNSVVTSSASTEQEKQRGVVHSGSERVLEAARNEWDKVTTVQAGYVEGNTKGAEPTVIATLTPMSPFELTEILKQEDFTNVKSNIKTNVERKGLAAFVNFLFGPPKLKRPLVEEKERIFCIAASQLSNDNPSHLRTLQTIYRSLTGSKFDNARYGSHWEEIGFQGTDPGTDLRSVGFLGLVNLLFLLKTPRTLTLASDIYRLSLHPTQNFPFCVMGINMTRIMLQVLREDLLNKECNRRGDVLGVVCEFYVGLYLLLFQVWKGQNKTISDSGFVIKDIEIKARKNTNEVFKNLEDYLTKKTTIVADKTHGKETENLDFVNVCEDS